VGSPNSDLSNRLESNESKDPSPFPPFAPVKF
jgi:hypothetical protein